MSYDQMTLLDLKKLCKERGLKVSGKISFPQCGKQSQV